MIKYIIIFILLLQNIHSNNTQNITVNKKAIIISQDTVNKTLEEYNKTLNILSDSQKSIEKYHVTLEASITSLKHTYKEISPKIEDKTNKIISSIEDMNSTVQNSMSNIEKNIDDYYVIEIVALIVFLISVNNILEIIIKLKKFKFIKKRIKKLKKYFKNKQKSRISIKDTNHKIN